MIEVVQHVGTLMKAFSADETPGSDYDLAADFLVNDTEYANYLISHEQAKEARRLLSRLAGGLMTLQELKEKE